MTHTWESYSHCQYLWRQKTSQNQQKICIFLCTCLNASLKKKHKLIWIKLEVLHLIMSNKHIPKHHFFWQNCTLTNWSKCETKKSSIYPIYQHLNAFYLSLWNYQILNKYMYKSFNNFHLVFFFWEQCEKSDRDCLVKQDAHGFFIDARGFFSRSSWINCTDNHAN